ncbi:uncharacterized protein LOC119477388 [Sebastes umbrosus]|uniref:uncharacterized protein LOC119477388 n=1 Tax=Sebastes umbrosus TaxID=72105 RepID=UPI0018A04BDB|nr:uncharacterized protein LOC119477388 [Sebastes umbrosus]
MAKRRAAVKETAEPDFLQFNDLACEAVGGKRGKMETPKKVLLRTLEDLGSKDFEKFKWYLQQPEFLEGFPAIPKSRLENAERELTVTQMFLTYSINTIKVTKIVLGEMNQNDLVEKLSKTISEPAGILAECQRTLKYNLQKRFQYVFEKITKAGNSKLLNQIYTEIYISMEETGEVNMEHEVRKIETASRKPDRPETTIRYGDIFKASPGSDEPIRTLMTKGVAGIGKTVLTQKFTLDWAEDKANQDIQFTFPFTFRELNLLKEKKYSLVELVHHFFTETKAAEICRFEEFPIVFIFDGLDECRLPLDFHNNEILTDVTESTSVDVLLTNLIRGKLLPSARLWITTRPAAANQIPRECVDRVTEVRGFTNPQKEEYFKKRFKDEEQTRTIISHIKTSRSLHIMCHIPVFCWITATVLEKVLETGKGGELPKTLTEMYIHFLVVQSKKKNVKYHGKCERDPHWSPENTKMVESLGKLAFEQLQKGNLIFYESDLKECDIDIRAASVYSGVFTEIFEEERGLYENTVFCFVHLSVQEFLAALHVHLTFINSGVNLMAEATWWSKFFGGQPKLTHLHHSAVDKALQSPNGHLDLFLRFLLGLSLETNQYLLRGLLIQTGSSSQTNQETVKYLKKKITENLSPERSINLFHCLNELNDGSLVEEIQQYLSSGHLSTDKLSPAQWSALVFILLSSEKDLDVFDLKKYSGSEDALLRLLPVVKASNKALLSGCNLSERSCEALSSDLSSQSSSLRELDLSNNNLQDSGVKLLSVGLESPHCTLETLRLSDCRVTEAGCASLASALGSKSSHLRELDLCNNDLKDSGVKLLSVGLQSPNWKLETLRLSGCLITKDGCVSVASALSSNPSHLRELDLSYNHPGDSGVKLLSARVEDPRWILETLKLSDCLVTEAGCASLASALRSESSHLRELDLSNNDLQDSGVKPLSVGLQDPHCTLKTLRLSDCRVTEAGCASLASALWSESSHLRELDLSNNDLQDSGVKPLCVGLKSPHCALETLRLSGCLITKDGCASLASALSSNPSHLRELDLSYNHPGDSGVKLLSAGMEDPRWRLETLKVDHDGEQRLKPSVRKYFIELKLDGDTKRYFSLSDNWKAMIRKRSRTPSHGLRKGKLDQLTKLLLSDDNNTLTLDRKMLPSDSKEYDYGAQMLCRDGLTGRCYWEVEWREGVCVAVTYRGGHFRGGDDYLYGCNDQSWSLNCTENGYSVCHNDRETRIPSSSSSSSSSGRVAVYVDYPAGTLSFYRVSSDTLIHLHTFNTTFTEPLYPAFAIVLISGGPTHSSVSLCSLLKAAANCKPQLLVTALLLLPDLIYSPTSGVKEQWDSLNTERGKMETPKKVLLRTLEDLGSKDFEKFKWCLQQPEFLEGFPAIPLSRLENAERELTVTQMFLTYSINTIKVTKIVLVKMNQNDLVEKLSKTISEPAGILAECQRTLKNNLQKKFQYVFEGTAKAGNSKPLNQIYTEIYISMEETGEVNMEHEIRQIETASRKPDRPETTIRCEDIFKASPGSDEPIRTVMTKGVASIGKTVLTQKFTLDWAEDKANQDIQFTFPFTFRELNVLKEKKYSLVELVHHFFTETKAAGICRFEEFPVVFIFDGLDECRPPLDFHNNEILTDVTESTSVGVLLTNLIRGKLLPSARLWITTRPAAANQIPPECVDIVTEVRGFTDPQKEEYFRKRFRDEEQTSTIISHIKTSRSLHIMCHIPVFCWITATVLENVLKTREGGELPKTLTEMYIHFLVVQSKLKNIKYDGGAETDPHWSPESRKMIESLGKLAFDQLKKGNLIFYESDLTESDIDIREASMYSGVFTKIFEEEGGLYQDKVFCFVHLSVQEFLAALHVHLTFINSGVNLMAEATWWSTVFRGQPRLTQLHQSAVDKALQSPNGHLDLFLRFLLGLSLEINQCLLRGLLKQIGSSSQINQETVKYIKKKITENLSPEKSINLFHCLNELNDDSLVEEIQQYLGSGCLSTDKLSPAQWSALSFILLSSEKDLEVFDLKKYSASEEVLLRLLPVVKASNKALLSGCNLSERSCEALSSVLSSQSSSLRELDLSNNDLQDSGVKPLSVGLQGPHCTLETLRLSGCLITKDGCASLASALSSNPSHLRELDLSYNHPEDSGVKLLSAGVEDPHWRLETLKVDHDGQQWLKPGLRKYFIELTLDCDTKRYFSLSNDNKTMTLERKMPLSDFEEYDYWEQLLCRDGLTGRCYWEVEWRGAVNVAVTYRGGHSRGGDDSWYGRNDQSWSLDCSELHYSVWHNDRGTHFPSSSSSSSSGRVAVYVDYPAGTLSFYRVSSDTLIHLHTFNTTFTEPLYPAFTVALLSGEPTCPSVSLCSL